MADTDGPGSRDVGFGIALQADGKIVQTGFQNATRDIVVVRWDSSGCWTIVRRRRLRLYRPWRRGFPGPTATTSRSSLTASCWSAGTTKTSDRSSLCLRYNTDGSLDTGFGSGRIVTTSVGRVSDIAYSAALQSDGGIILVGTSSNGSNNDLARSALHQWRHAGHPLRRREYAQRRTDLRRKRRRRGA